MLSLFLLTFKGSYKLSTKNHLAIPLITAGLNAGATFNVTVTSSSIDRLMVGLLTEAAYNAITEDSYRSTCINGDHPNFSDYQEIYEFSNTSKTATFTGTVVHKAIYYQFFYGCNADSFVVEVSCHFKNPNSWIDSRYDPLFTVLPIMAAIMGLVLIIWLINWFINFKVQIYIHYCFTATLSAMVISAIAYTGYTSAYKRSESPLGASIFYFITLIIKYVIVFSTILLAAKGWCILVDTIKLCEFFLAFIYSACAVACFILIIYTNFTFIVQAIVLLIGLVFTALYMHNLIVSINKLNHMMIAYMLVIQQHGIDPTTTPIQHKKRMYQFYSGFLISCVAMVIIYLIVRMFVDMGLWIPDLLSYLFESYFMIGILSIFFIRNQYANGYTSINDTNGPTEEFSLADIENAGANFTTGQGTQWSPGMTLPSQPEVTEGPKQISLESPDGVEEIEIAPGSYADQQQQQQP